MLFNTGMRKRVLRTVILAVQILGIASAGSSAMAQTKSATAIVLSPRTQFSPVQSCQLDLSVARNPPFSLGYRRDSMWGPTRGDYRIAVVYLSYLDATINPKAMNEMVDVQELNSQKFYTAASYGRLHLSFLDSHTVHTVQKNLLTYNLKGDGPDMNTVFTDAMTAAFSDYDFSKVDGLAIVLPDSLPASGIGPSYGREITVGGDTITRGVDLTYINPENHRVIDSGWLTHELGHTLGLTHPFLYGLPPAPYAWDVMLYDNTWAPDLFTWEKYILGWLDDSEVDCVNSPISGTFNVLLQSNGSSSSATKMLMYRLSDTQAIVVESRRKSSLDLLTRLQEGVLVYKLDISKGFGEGEITLVYNHAQIVNNQKFGTEMYGSLRQGEKVTTSGLLVTVLKSTSNGDYVSIASAK